MGGVQPEPRLVESRRRFARIALTAQVKVTFEGVADRRRLLLDNLSQGGLFIRTKNPKPIGTKLNFEFSVRDGAGTIQGSGIVRWIETDPSRAPGMGIQFTMLNEEGKRELRTILQTTSGKPLP